MPLIFISHASLDKPVIDDLFDLLQTGCNLKMEEIFCTSVEGAGIKTGADFLKWIQDHLNKSQIVILFLTPNYTSSPFCLAEMGAAWALKRNVFPLLIPSMKRDPGSVLLGKQTAVVNETGLDELRDIVASYYSEAAKATARWSVKKEQFLKKFIVKVKELPTPQLVDRSEVDSEKEKTSAAMELNNELTRGKEILLEQIAELEKVKDAAAVEKIKNKFTPENQRYENLVEIINSQLSDLTVVEVRCLYAFLTSELWQPGKDEYRSYEDNIKKAILRKRIKEDSDYEGELGLTANQDHPKMLPVIKSIKNLKKFIEHKMTSKEIKRLEEKAGLPIQIGNIEYWEKILYGIYMPP